MTCKKMLITTTLISLTMLLPGISFSKPIHKENTLGNFYVSGKYVPSVSHFGNFSAKEEKHVTTQIFGIKESWSGSMITDGNRSIFNIPHYSFKYENNPFLGFAGVIGYSMGGPRIEFEVLYETFDVQNPGDKFKNDGHKYCALSHNTTTSIASGKFVFLKNDGLSDISLMLNACYNITTERMPFSPYICAGIGTDLIFMFETIHSKAAYQGKLGFNYPINPESAIFTGLYFHKVYDNKFRVPALLAVAGLLPDDQFAIVELSVCYFGLELGYSVNF
ncbi:Surface antigen msp4 [Ehrlichia minasensis]|nr:Surface antigen msp4 [Ehrlichia minasensis]